MNRKIFLILAEVLLASFVVSLNNMESEVSILMKCDEETVMCFLYS
jgi:hypothetical protein